MIPEPVAARSEPVAAAPEPAEDPDPQSEPEPDDDRPRGLFGRRSYQTPRARRTSRDADAPSYARKDAYVPWGEVPSEIAAESAIEDESHDPDMTRPIKPWEA